MSAAKKNLAPGGTLGRYELLTPIAQGGMASVWAARQTGLHGFRKTVAIKTILPQLSEDPQFEQMFLSEARLAMRVHHPNVVEILDLGEDESLLYQVMAWIDGESLSTLLKVLRNTETGLPRRFGAYICLKACLGLHAAHEVTDDDDNPVGIVHRDVSPQNVMVTYDGHVKVVDFGVAKSQSESGSTLTGQFKGKVPYMAPEQGTGGAIDRRTDVFSMGSLLYRVTVGRAPFGTDNQMATLNAILTRPPPPIRAQDPDYPEALEAVVMRCLQKDPSARYSTMAELAEDLERVLVSMGPVTEQELAAFIRLHLGEQRKERRANMRAAAQTLGWAFASSESLPRLSLTTGAHAINPSMTPTTGPSHSGALGTPVSHQSAAGFSISGPRKSIKPKPKPPGPARTVLLALGLVASAAAGIAIARWALSTPTPATQAKAPDAGPSVATPRPSAEATPPAEVPRPTASAESPPATPSGSAEAPTAPRVTPGAWPPRSNPKTPPAKSSAPAPKSTGAPSTWSGGPDVGF